MSFRSVKAAALAALALALVGVAPAAAQDTGTVRGVVMDATTSRPLPSAQVFIEGTQLGTLTDQQGRYTIQNVPVGTHTVSVQLIGYTATPRAVTVQPGQIHTVNFQVEDEALLLQEVVVTGVVGATARARVPFTVDQVRSEDMPVPAVSAGGMLQGKVAGAQIVSSGRPGAGHSILLRGPTSLNASGRGQGPMIIVDGVILGESMVDIGGLDIESMEVVKGAAAASLYGSRAAAGVVNITTRTGRGLVGDQVNYSLRSELGRNELPNRLGLTQHHHYKLSGDPAKPFVDATGTNFAFGDRLPSGALRVPVISGTNIWNTFQDQAWPEGPFDHVGTFFENGVFQQHQISATGRAGAMNFHAAASAVDEGGVVWNQPGYQRQSFRLNVDQGIGEQLQISGRSFFSRSNSGQFPESQGNPLFNLTRMPAGVDITRLDSLGEYNIRPMPGQENDNPLEELAKREYTDERDRFLGSANLRWSPVVWFDMDLNASYDRASQLWEDFYPVGYQTARVNTTVNNGHLFRAHTQTDALNTSITGTVRRNLGDNLAARFQGRYLYEAQDYDRFDTWGSDFAIRGLRTLQATRAEHGRFMQLTSVRSEGFFGIMNLDYAGRYITDMLIRRDGSSLFGEAERWQTYYRLAGTWRIAEEPWWNMPSVNEFRLRYSVGTAGGRPNFFAQYETYNVSTTGLVTPQVLGNPNLKPEHVTEHEFGAELGLLNRFTATATYARSTAEDQILQVPLPAISGWVSTWRNAGTLASNTLELGLTADILQGPVGWTSRLLFDRTRQEITQLNVPPFTYGISTIQGLENVFYMRQGEAVGTIYGHRFATSCADLPTGWESRCGEFATNDDGYFVWVGQGGNLSNPAWGTFNPETAGAEVLWWGTPFASHDADGNTFMPIGNTTPDFRWSLGNTFTHRGFRLYALLDAERGFDVYNLPRHWMTFQLYSQEGDQAGLPQDQKKPIGYYANLYRNLTPKNSHFVEDGSYVKLREVSLGYRLDGTQLAGIPGINNFSGIGLSLTGRNLVTWTNYQGYDPEVGVAGGLLGSAALNRFDGFSYPNFRTWTMAVELNF
jgi:TonB-linked SusC/RagA family outer membrane protein